MSATKALLAQRKLFGVLDLDHTLLHTTKDARASAFLEKEPDLFEFQLPLPHPADTTATYYVKLRPGLERFLDAAVQLFDLHIYTMGSRAYAHAVVSLTRSSVSCSNNASCREKKASLPPKNRCIACIYVILAW